MYTRRRSEILNTVSVALLFCLATIITPMQSSAQDWLPGRYMRESIAQILAAGKIIEQETEFGFSDTCFLGAYLREGNNSFMTTELQRGETYLFIGAGNQPARDVDIIIKDDDGDVVIKDTKIDAVAVVLFTPRITQRYTIYLRLYKANSPCFCGMALLRKGGWRVPIRNLSLATNNVLRSCENIATQTEAKFLDEPGEWAMIGSILRDGDSSIFTDMRLGTGRRAITAGGDTQTRDIDLVVFEDLRQPRILDSDKESDSNPLVSCRTSRLRRYGVSVQNARSRGATMIMTALLDVD
jgi:hypothetical protein